jgi:nitrate reductase gamma subunit
MLLIALFPFTYLVHIPLAPLALGLAILRRRRHAIA